MRRFVVGLVATAGAFVVSAAPGGAAPSRAAHDHVAGRATHLGADPPYPRITVLINAFSEGDGSNPRGMLIVDSSDIGQRRRGRVTCLNVHGNTATVGIRILSAEDTAVVGKGELFNVVDNGKSHDQIAGYPITEKPPTECPPLPFSVPVVSSDYRVTDETP